MTCDIHACHAHGENHPARGLHAGTLACAAIHHADESESNDVSSIAVMNVQSTRSNVDQPFVRALAISKTDHIYVGVNDFNQPSGAYPTVDVRSTWGDLSNRFSIEARNTAGQDGPSVVRQSPPDNTVYAGLFRLAQISTEQTPRATSWSCATMPVTRPPILSRRLETLR